MEEIEYITLEDNLEYVIVDEIMLEGIKYLILVNSEIKNSTVRKLDDKENLVKVTPEEQQRVYVEFTKKHINDVTK